jgi:hypothetical protein
MKNNQSTVVDLISTNETVVISNAPLTIGIIAISAFALSFFVETFIVPGIGIILFFGAFILSIVGLAVSAKYKKHYADISAEQKKKLQWGKGLSLTTLILSLLAIVAVISLIVLIGVNGFGR